jgi:hypothetical protein
VKRNCNAFKPKALDRVSKDGQAIIKNLQVPNQFQLKKVRKSSMGKVKDLLNFQYENSHQPKSTEEEGPPRYFSALDWNYVIIEQDQNPLQLQNFMKDQDILDHETDASIKIHDQKGLFEDLNRHNPPKNLC